MYHFIKLDFMKILLSLIALIAISLNVQVFAQNAKDITLPAPNKNGGKPLMEALNARSSAREFSAKELSMQEISDLLWAADGVNRAESGKRTAPTAMNWQDTDIYLVIRSGIYLYLPKEHKLLLKKEGDFMKATGKQPFVANAALNLVFVANLTKMKDAKESDKLLFAGIHTGCISQNVYLYCASVGLNTVTRRMIDIEELSKTIGLSKDEIITLSQTVGFKP